MRLGPAVVVTPDIDEAMIFYRDKLGLTLGAAHPDHLIFEASPTRLHVFAGAGAEATYRHGEDAATVLTFEVGDIAREMHELSARGVAFLHAAPVINAKAGLRYAAFKAPGGLVHELVELIS